MVAGNGSKLKPKNEADTLTILRSRHGEMRKSWRRLSHKERWRKSDYDRNATYYDHTTATASTVDELYHVLSEVANDPKACIIRGRLAPGRPAENIRRTTTKINPGLDEMGRFKGFFVSEDRRWVCPDIDAGTFPKGIDPDAANVLEIAAMRVRDEILGSKAPELIGVRCVAQWSASAGFESIGRKADNLAKRGAVKAIKLHLWFRLDRPVCNESLRPWLAGMGADAALARTVQPHFVATPHFSDERGRELPDPLAWRLRLLPGEHDEITAPAELVDAATWQACEDERIERQEKEQARIRAEARQHGVTSYSKTGAQSILEDSLDKLYSTAHGSRHPVVYGQSYWIGRVVAGNNGLTRWDAQDAMEAAVRTIFAGERDLPNELKAVQDGMDAGAADPFYLDRKPYRQPIVEKIDETGKKHRFASLAKLRVPLAQAVKAGLTTPGTTLLVAPTGAGKSTEAAKVAALLSEYGGDEVKVLWAAPTIKTRSEATALLKREGIRPYEVIPRNKQNCAAFSRYQYANAIKSGGGARYCKDACPHHIKRPTGRCVPPPGLTPPKDASVMVVSHELATVVGDQWEPTHVVWDEDAKIEPSEQDTLTAATIRQAVDAAEIDGAEALLKLLGESETREIEASELQDALAEAGASVDLRAREDLLRVLEDTNQSGGDVVDWRLIEAFGKCCDRDGAGARIEAGRLIFDTPLPVPTATTRLIMDATATPLAAQAIYGDHNLERFELAPNDHVSHLHIVANCGNRAVGTMGAWENARLGRLWEVLRTTYPGALMVAHKAWIDALPEHFRPDTYYNATDAKGSNKYQDRQAVILADNFVPTSAKDARVKLWLELLREQGKEADTENLATEAVYQMEIAPMMQAAGRIRYHEATADNPKMIITIGKDRRVGALGHQADFVTLDDALLDLRGEVTQRNVGMVAQAIADEKGGVWLEDLTGWQKEEKPLENNQVPINGISRINIYGISRLLARPCFLKGKHKDLLVDWWHHSARSVVRARPHNKGAAVLFLPPASGNLSGIAQRAAQEGWQGWTVHDRQGNELQRVDYVEAAIQALPHEAADWSRDQLVAHVAEATGASARTVQRRLAALGGLTVLRDRLQAKAPPQETVEVIEPIALVANAKGTTSARFSPLEPLAAPPCCVLDAAVPTPTPEDLLLTAGALGYPRISLGNGYYIEESANDWHSKLGRWDSDPFLRRVAGELLQLQGHTAGHETQEQAR